jgi:hypothetical protein
MCGRMGRTTGWDAFVAKGTAESLAHFSQRGSLRTGEPQTGGKVRSQDPVLGPQVFVLQQQLLVYHTRYIGQQPRPFSILHSGRTSYVIWR